MVRSINFAAVRQREQAAHDLQLQQRAEGIEGPDELVASLGGLVTAVTADAEAIKEAERLEAEATRVRDQGKQDLYGALETAGTHLQELSQSGEVEPRTLLESFVAVYNYSERFHPGWPDLRNGPRAHRPHQPNYYHADELLAVFDVMKAGEPVVGLDSAPTGILKKDATVKVTSNGLDIQKNHLNIHAAIVLPMRLITKEGLAPKNTTSKEKIAITSSELPLIVGETAVIAYFQQLTARADYERDACGHGSYRTSNTNELIEAFRQVQIFQTIGLDLETASLEAEIAKGQEADRQHRLNQALRRQQRRSRSPFYR